MARKIEVVPYDARWPILFEQEAEKVSEILGDNCVALHHIGSTSVPGLSAKPIIDMMPVVKDIDKVDIHNAEFEALGYQCMGEYGIEGRRFFMKGGDNRTHHIHIFEETNQTDIGRHLAVRDFLRSHPDAADEYARLKTRLAQIFTYDSVGYSDGKDDFVKALEQKAINWQSDPEKDVVIELIKDKRETLYVDYKRDFYPHLHGSDFPKDVAAFANLIQSGDKYIVFGVEDKTREVYGIDPNTFASADNMDAYISETIEPFVDISSGIFPYRGRWVGYIKILSTNQNPPYMIKNTCGKEGKIEMGDIYIRKGTCNVKATRMDVDAMYHKNEHNK